MYLQFYSLCMLMYFQTSQAVKYNQKIGKRVKSCESLKKFTEMHIQYSDIPSSLCTIQGLMHVNIITPRSFNCYYDLRRVFVHNYFTRNQNRIKITIINKKVLKQYSLYIIATMQLRLKCWDIFNI